ncbi:MAG: hypothetical protein JW990_11450 [Thermoleophilia bacterium]|nr:hypothetical protein [Thermoleophilia bacterium]
MRHHLGPGALALLVLATAACGGAEPSAVAVTDSAGVRITLSAETSATFAVVDTVPVLSLGGADVAGPTQFGNVNGVRVDQRGNLWVADGQSAEVRLFHSDGSFWKSVGGRGEGPGEFASLRLLGSFRGDSVAVWDDSQGRLTVLDPEGNLARVLTAKFEDDAPPNAFRVFHDGTVLARLRKVLQAGALEPGAIIPDTAIFARVDYASMRSEPEGAAPAPRWLWTGHSSIPIPFTLNPGFDLSGEEVHVTSGPSFRIRVLRGGRLVESYGLDRSPAPVTAADKQDYTDMVVGTSGESPRRDEYLSVLRHPQLPTLLPAYRSIVVADNGDVWAERYAYGTFDVYGPDRVFRGRVNVPVMLTQVVGSKLVGVWRNDLDVEHVRIYRFQALP